MKKEATQSKPVAVLISDIHFTVPTLELATTALREAMARAKAAGVPLILAGDTTDGKAIMRAEVSNRLIELCAEYDSPETLYIMVGNHDLINEKGAAHALHFLRPYAQIVEDPVMLARPTAFLVPYMHDVERLKSFLANVEPGTTLIMHQGVQGADMGHYVQDRTSLPQEAYANFRVISGHYHKSQDIKCGPPRKGAVGLFSYIGNPYTLTFGEAKHPPKGYAVLMSDGLLQRFAVDLRKHLVIEASVEDLSEMIEECHALGAPLCQPNDLIWFKVSGPVSLLSQLKKTDLQEWVGHLNFKLDRIYTDTPALEDKKGDKLTGEQMLDALIDQTEDTPAQKEHLKKVWRGLMA